MAVRIKFDSTHNAIPPTLVLATRSGKKIGSIPAYNIILKDGMNECSEMSFRVNKADCVSVNNSEYIHKSPLSVYNLIASTMGYDRIGSLSNESKYEFIQYLRIYNKLNNIVLKFTGDKSKSYKSPLIKYDGDYETIYVADSNTNSILVKIDANGNVFINNASSIGYSKDDSCRIEFSFDVPTTIIDSNFWKQIVDFKLTWVREWDKWFEIYVELDESNDTIKNVSAKSLGEAELSQINLYDIEINTENDILRDNYKPTVLFDETNSNASLLSRIMEKAPHYKINHIDASIAHIQRTFTFDGKSIYDAFQEIAEEIDCLFVIDCHSDSEGNIVREINVYDLETYCLECGERGTFNTVCEKCGSENIKHGYGKDTTIFVSTENLADNIKYSTDNGSVKNCFKLEAGDDLMTATLVNCNPNGSGYIWYISDATKEDMSDELVQKLSEYDKSYEYYQKEYQSKVSPDTLTAYNNLIEKYKVYSTDYKKVTSPIVGYPALMEAYYNTVDFYLYLNNSLMPNIEIQRTTAALEAAKLNYANLSPVAVKNLNVCSAATAESAVLAMAKIIVDNRYQVKITDTTFADKMWSGVFVVTNYSDEEDTATSKRVTCEINDDYENYVKQKIDKTLNKTVADDDATDIIQLFDLSLEDFEKELKKYSLSRLTSFHDSCQSCLDILIEQGIANNETWANKSPNLYIQLYVPYYNKLGAIESEMKLRELEIAIIIGTFDKDGDLVSEGMQTFLDSDKDIIQNELNFEKYLGEKLWLEFSAYRREDTYSNDNYISDGLDNSELFQTALEFIEVAKKDIFKSATLQHSISATLKNLLAIKEFEPIVDYFEVGNWLRVRVDDNIYRLRLLNYEIDFDNLENITITFSDVTVVSNGTSDIESILNQASSMATSYGSISRQAKQGNKSKDQLDSWVAKGLALTKMKIIDNADNQNISWDSHGLLCKEYLPITDTYDDKQLKLINRGLYLTDDNWLTSRAGIGDFTFWNPQTQQMEETYGVIADTLVGNLILSEKVGIYNTKNSITLDENGIIITADDTVQGQNQMALTVQRKELDENGDEYLTNVMYLDDNGNLVLNGSIRINSSSDQNISSLDELADTSRYTEEIAQIVYDEIHGENGVYTSIDRVYLDSVAYTQSMLENYKADVGQYMTFDENGLTLGATTSAFKTVIDNQRLAFMDGNNAVAYISNNQLYIPNAVIQQTLTLGKFFFSPRIDGGVSLVWQGGVS